MEQQSIVGTVGLSKILQRSSLCNVEVQILQDYEIISAPKHCHPVTENWGIKYNVSCIERTQKLDAGCVQVLKYKIILLLKVVKLAVFQQLLTVH